jgi:hypothetical protein
MASDADTIRPPPARDHFRQARRMIFADPITALVVRNKRQDLETMIFTKPSTVRRKDEALLLDRRVFRSAAVHSKAADDDVILESRFVPCG